MPACSHFALLCVQLFLPTDGPAGQQWPQEHHQLLSCRPSEVATTQRQQFPKDFSMVPLWQLDELGFPDQATQTSLQAPICPSWPALQANWLRTPSWILQLLFRTLLPSSSHICFRSNSYKKSLIPIIPTVALL